MRISADTNSMARPTILVACCLLASSICVKCLEPPRHPDEPQLPIDRTKPLITVASDHDQSLPANGVNITIDVDGTTITYNSSEIITVLELPAATQTIPTATPTPPPDVTTGKLGAQNDKDNSQPRDDERYFIDLTHPLHNNMPQLAQVGNFNYSIIERSGADTSGGEKYFLKTDKFTMTTHTGTHLDAPHHFKQDGQTVDQIDVSHLVNVPISLVDVSLKVEQNRSYEFVAEDFIDPKTNLSLISPGSVLLIYTGLSEFWDQGEAAYYGSGNRIWTEMRYPGFTLEAARYVNERGAYGVGLDSPSADSSNSNTFNFRLEPRVHEFFAASNMFIVENIDKRMKELFNRPMHLIRLTIAPLPILGASGSPIRLVATQKNNGSPNLATNHLLTISLFALFAAYASTVLVKR